MQTNLFSTYTNDELIDKIIRTAKDISINMNKGCLFRGVIHEELFGPVQWSQLKCQVDLINELRRRNGKPKLTHTILDINNA